MVRMRWLASALVGFAVMAVVPVAFAQRRGARPATSPSNALVSSAADAVATGTLKEFSAKIEQRLAPLLRTPKTVDPDELLTLASLREFARYWGRLDNLDGTSIQTLQWLVRQTDLRNALMMGASQFDTPDRVLHVLQVLRDDQKDKLNQLPEVAAAICLVWDQPANQRHGTVVPDDDPTTATSTGKPRALMNYFLTARTQLRIDPQQLPVELAVYLVDNPIDEDELAWAFGRYSSRDRVGSVFFDVNYDTEAYAGRAKLKLTKQRYSLMNILELGGICGDQAYFAAQVARTIGVPATICTGKGGIEGVGHAWVGFLEVRGNRAAWNFDEGRYTEQLYWKGRVVDPQTRESLSDSDVSMLAELWSTPRQDRLVSVALSKSADLADKNGEAAIQMQAINLSPGNRRAWLALSDLAANSKLNEKQFADFAATVSRFAAKRFPDFAFTVLEHSISGRTPEKQIAALEDLRKAYSSDRPDLLAAIRVAQGDLYRRLNQPDAALASYGEALSRSSNLGPVVLDAMEHVDSLLHEANALPKLAEVYDTVWKRMPQPEASIAIQSTPYYRIGERYSQLLGELHQPAAADNVRARLDSLTQNVPMIRR